MLQKVPSDLSKTSITDLAILDAHGHLNRTDISATRIIRPEPLLVRS
jgi:hypothetical protein